MRMKALLVASGALGIAGAVHAAISPGVGVDDNPPGELFLTVWDENNQVSYTRDLGIGFDAFIASPSQSISVSSDSLYESTFAPLPSGDRNLGLVYSLGACNLRFEDFPTPGFGLLLSSNNTPGAIGLPDFTALNTATTTCGFYARGANTNAQDLDNFPANLSSRAMPGEEAYYAGVNWNGNVGDTVPFQTGAQICKYLRVHSLVLNGDGESVDRSSFSLFRLGPDGTLEYPATPSGSDVDGDGFFDEEDNCLDFPNANQRDTDGDGIGNDCDPDLDNNGVVDFSDVAGLKASFFATANDPGYNPDADFNGDGQTNFADLGRLRQFVFGPPGPTGCAVQ